MPEAQQQLAAVDWLGADAALTGSTVTVPAEVAVRTTTEGIGAGATVSAVTLDVDAERAVMWKLTYATADGGVHEVMVDAQPGSVRTDAAG